MRLKWDERGLVPAVVVDATSGATLMLAWMNEQALAETLLHGTAYFWSRSRNALWKKGETSGSTLRVRDIRVDCDEDALLLTVEPAGPACHTGKTSCFYRTLREWAPGTSEPQVEDDGPRGAPAAIVDRVAGVIEARKHATADKSYTRSLLDAGMPKILAKIAEEHAELADELAGEPVSDEPAPDQPAADHAVDAHAIAHETADLLYHVLVGLAARGVPTSAVWDELARRFGTSGHDEKAARPKP